MNPQPAERATFISRPSTHLHLDAETCPTCGQQIPPDKLEEISGRIVAKEREQKLAITVQLEKQYSAEKARADAKAEADLESERQSSAAREARARDEAQRATEKLLREQRAEAEKERLKLLTESQQQLEKAESARKSAEQAEANLNEEMRKLRDANANELEAFKAQATRREIEVQNEAKQSAESAVALRIAAIELAQRESEASLQQRIDKAEASKISAEQKEAALALQLDQQREANKAEVTRVKEEAAAESERIRQAAYEAADLHLRDTLAAREKDIADANAKRLEAEQHTAELENNLAIQREALEKATEDAVNAERAKAFDESQKLSAKVNELQRALEKKTNEELGEGAEIDLFEALRAEFPDDKIARISKGAPGADIRQAVMLRGKECGTILYDSKIHKGWRDEFVAKLKKDQLADKAQHAILSTHSFPRNTRQIHIQDGVLLANPARVVTLAAIVRQHMIQIHTLRLCETERESKTAALYDYITSEQCSQLLGRIDQRADALLKMQEAEMKWHRKTWNTQAESIRAIQKAKVNLEIEIASIIGTSALDGAMSEAS